MHIGGQRNQNSAAHLSDSEKFYFNFIIVLIVEAVDRFTAQPVGVLVCEELIEWCGPEIRAQPPFA